MAKLSPVILLVGAGALVFLSSKKGKKTVESCPTSFVYNRDHALQKAGEILARFQTTNTKDAYKAVDEIWLATVPRNCESTDAKQIITIVVPSWSDGNAVHPEMSFDETSPWVYAAITIQVYEFFANVQMISEPEMKAEISNVLSWYQNLTGKPFDTHGIY